MDGWKKYSKKLASFLAAVTACGALFPAGDAKAAEKMSVSEKEYNLDVEDMPDGVGPKVYAKLHDGSLPAEEYMLSLFDGYDAEVAMGEALEAAGEKLADIDFLAMEVTLYQCDEEGDYYPLDELGGITVICPIPEDYADRAEELQITAVNENGKLERLNSSLVVVDGVTCVKFDLSKAEIYAFLVKEGGKLTAGTVPTATPAPAEAKPSPTKAASAQAPASTPTPAPTKAAGIPTPKPTKAANTPTPKPTKAADASTPTKATSTPAPTKAAGTSAPAPTKAGGNLSGSVGAVKDRTPQTGDGFDRERYLALLGIGIAAFGGILFVYMKKK